ncbi:hypothetical protein MKW98_010886 [Papaver atlanticum]|uniref:PGG domain-containing protein n=1 Tax=Papaver atlanticum TaxID=357466 RepID=A0AAD4XFE5_9MAGN|nr:hypothetical protein MKW98_010886 [Papaver atlanticum]
MEIMEIYPNLASNKNGDGTTASHLLALSPTSFKSGTMYGEQYLGATPIVLAKKAAAIVSSLIPIENYETHKAANHITLQPDSSLKEKLTLHFRLLCKGFPVLKLLHNAKLQHTYAIQLLRKLLEKDYGQWTMSYDPPHGWDDNNKNHENRHPLSAITTRVITYKVRERPIILATKLGIIKMFKEIIKSYQESIGVCDEEAGRNLLHLAAEYRNESIVEFLMLKSAGIQLKTNWRNLDILVVGIDREGNTPLNAAAKIGKHKPWHIRGAAQWMQWECVWFEVCMLPPAMLTVKNCNEQYAHQVFTETHIDLREQGEIWLKEGSNNCMLISALIATVMFACTFTVPGGNDWTSAEQCSNTPLLKNQDFGPFFHYVSYSLFSSLISLVLFLSIHAAPFNEYDFFFQLPLSSVIAILLYSIQLLSLSWTGVLFFSELYVDIIVGFIRYLIDIIFI